jgi:peptidyl-dipeptidase A
VTLVLLALAPALAADPPLPLSTAPMLPPGVPPTSIPLPHDLRAREEARAFLDVYNSVYVGLVTVASESAWAASTDVRPANEGRRVAADEAYAAFVGDPVIADTARRLLQRRASLEPLQVRQLEKVLHLASSAPGSIPEVVRARIAAEARAAAVQDGFSYCFEPRAADGTCAAPKTANDVDAVLQDSTDLAERRRAWEASKQIGVPLKERLVELRDLRNRIARENGWSSYFGLMTGEYGMDAAQMMAVLDGISRDVRPLYGALSTWATRELARKYGQPAPSGGVPAHWFPNRWAQEWGGMVPAVDLDVYFKDRSPEWIVKTGEQFYVSLGFAALPATFWEKSDLYPVPDGVQRSKNSHASAWHMDLKDDMRSLMSVEPDANWFFTSHHELGHIYYYDSYARPEVPPILREGANRAFHEAVGELIAMAAGQVPYLRNRGILPPDVKVNPTQALLEEALTRSVAFLPWSAGVMSGFEYALYEKDLAPDQFQARWWALVNEHQGVVPPDPARVTDPSLCDACTKTHIIDDPAGYYDYALATVIKHQLHDHIATRILKQDPRACDYYGNAEVGAYLRGILEKGATEDWRLVLKDATGEDLSTRALMAYYAPLKTWLDKENRKRK